MTGVSAEKSRQLGMPLGTAQGRLRKIVLFSLLARVGENICYRCKNLIESSDELSMEHRQPWLHVSVDLFWDIDNIAFSHHSCNSGSARTDTPAQKERLRNLHAKLWAKPVVSESASDDA